MDPAFWVSLDGKDVSSSSAPAPEPWSPNLTGLSGGHVYLNPNPETSNQAFHDHIEIRVELQHAR